MAPRFVTAILLVLVLAACGGDDGDEASAASVARALDVTLLFHFQSGDKSGVGRDTDVEGSACGVTGLTRSTDRLAFMRAGAEVLLKDGVGAILSKAQLSNGVASNIDVSGSFETHDFHAEFDCSWRLDFGEVKPAAFFQVEVAGHELGTLSLDEVERADWSPTLRTTT